MVCTNFNETLVYPMRNRPHTGPSYSSNWKRREVKFSLTQLVYCRSSDSIEGWSN